MHCFPGMHFVSVEAKAFWKEKYVIRFNKIVSKHNQKVLFLFGAHTHFADIRTPRFYDGPDLSSLLLISPSVSPIYNNNPGYAILDLDLSNRNNRPQI